MPPQYALSSYAPEPRTLIDIFYDHILARDWERYAATPLDAFTAQVYAGIAPLLPGLPPAPRDYMERLIEFDVLGSYRHLAGVEIALQRIGRRLNARRPGVVVLEDSLPQLEARYEELSRDFAGFIPELAAHARHHLLPPPAQS